MRTRASYVIVGLFVLILGAVLIAGILWLTAGGPPRNYDYYFVYMNESVSGLNVDAAVRYKGVNRGRVREVDLDPQDPERVRLLLSVQGGTPIDRSTVARLEYQGLTGIAAVNLSGSGSDRRPIELVDNNLYPVIPSEPSLLARLDETVSDLLGGLIQTSERVNAFLDEENRAALQRALVSVATLSEGLAGQSGRIDALLQDLEATMRYVRGAGQQLPDLMSQLGDSAASLERMADSLATAGGTLSETGISLKSTVDARSADLEQFSRGVLPEAQTLVVELRLAAESMRRTATMLERDPRALLFGPPPVAAGPGEEPLR